MTFPGADTINEGIKGDDCFRCMAAAGRFTAKWPLDGTSGSNCVAIVSMGECSGVWVLWFIVVLRDLKVPAAGGRGQRTESRG